MDSQTRLLQAKPLFCTNAESFLRDLYSLQFSLASVYFVLTLIDWSWVELRADLSQLHC